MKRHRARLHARKQVSYSRIISPPRTTRRYVRQPSWPVPLCPTPSLMLLSDAHFCLLLPHQAELGCPFLRGENGAHSVKCFVVRASCSFIAFMVHSTRDRPCDCLLQYVCACVGREDRV
jgi:hypothetical protein